jgi:hypothetical protein
VHSTFCSVAVKQELVKVLTLTRSPFCWGLRHFYYLYAYTSHSNNVTFYLLQLTFTTFYSPIWINLYPYVWLPLISFTTQILKFYSFRMGQPTFECSWISYGVSQRKKLWNMCLPSLMICLQVRNYSFSSLDIWIMSCLCYICCYNCFQPILNERHSSMTNLCLMKIYMNLS